MRRPFLSRCVKPTGKQQFRQDKGSLVSVLRRGRIPHEPRFKSTNEEWKAQWNDLLSWSMMFAVAVHAVAFAFWPSWDTLDPWLDPDLQLLETGTAWISSYAEPSTGDDDDDDDGGGGGMAAASLALLEEPDSIPPGTGAGTRIGGSQLAVVAFSGGLRERLLGRSGPIPALVEPGPASARPALRDDPADLADDSADLADDPADLADDPVDTYEVEEVRVIVENPMLPDLALRLETRTLDLARLAGLRPEVILPGTSAWLLIRNPARVAEFMRIIAEQLGPETEGRVDVAVWIDERGSVEWSEITRSSGRQEMDEVALALFNEVTIFKPARDRGVWVSRSVIFSVPFPW